VYPRGAADVKFADHGFLSQNPYYIRIYPAAGNYLDLGPGGHLISPKPNGTLVRSAVASVRKYAVDLRQVFKFSYRRKFVNRVLKRVMKRRIEVGSRIKDAPRRFRKRRTANGGCICDRNEEDWLACLAPGRGVSRETYS